MYYTLYHSLLNEKILLWSICMRYFPGSRWRKRVPSLNRRKPSVSGGVRSVRRMKWMTLIWRRTSWAWTHVSLSRSQSRTRSMTISVSAAAWSASTPVTVAVPSPHSTTHSLPMCHNDTLLLPWSWSITDHVLEGYVEDLPCIVLMFYRYSSVYRTVGRTDAQCLNTCMHK